MITTEQLLKIPNKPIKMLLIGKAGSGKTHLSATFPKCIYAITVEGEEETWLRKPHLRKNVVGLEYFTPISGANSKEVFDRFEKFLDEVREKIKNGEVETFVLDNLTYFVDNKMLDIEHNDPTLDRTNPWDLYKKLRRRLTDIIYLKVITLPCNVVLNVHEMMESDEALKKKTDKSCPIKPNIDGGFRDDIEGMFSYLFYLTKQKTAAGYDYLVRTNLGNQRNARSRLTLPEVMKNVTYAGIMEEIKKQTQQSEIKQ